MRHGLDAAVSDFWRWAFSDLRDNTVRGVLAEFIVAAALAGPRLAARAGTTTTFRATAA